MESRFSGIKSKNSKKIEALSLHDHACFIYSSIDEQYNMIKTRLIQVLIIKKCTFA